ncbi:hypothetical protein [Burkholderia territorii]|uniref:hypothetical protein n=1 Tax=Burkholderia territorii TaxID=1503055 RepID=UPI0012DA7326|nr:hypothetical protein [Burkholderia territorii]
MTLVAVETGELVSFGVQTCVAYTGVDHEGAYKERPQQLFALWAITRIIAGVKGTSLEYKS